MYYEVMITSIPNIRSAGGLGFYSTMLETKSYSDRVKLKIKLGDLNYAPYLHLS